MRDKSYTNKHTIDFPFFNDFSFLEYLEWLVPLTKKSDISSLFTLHDLKYLRWLPDNTFDIDFSSFPCLETLVTSDYGKMDNWNKLAKLKVLHISRLKRDDCMFISELTELTDIQLSRSNLTSLEGLEGCKSLQRIQLVYCDKITEVASVLKNIPSLVSIGFSTCKGITPEERERIKKLNISVWFE